MIESGKSRRLKGHNAERYYVKIFREIGFTNCTTTRFSSRYLDSLKIDLDNLPFNIQIKAGEQKNTNFSKLLIEIKEFIKENTKDNNIIKKPLVIIHKKDTKRGTRKSEYNEIVYMTFPDLVKIINFKNDKM